MMSPSRRAAEMYLDNLSDTRGVGISLKTCAERYGVSVGSVHATVRRLRKERQTDDAKERTTR